MPKSDITKRAIADSFRSLLEAMPYDKITVSAIAEHAGINRQTFYYHFHDMYDLVTWICRNGVKQTVGEFTVGNWKDGVLALLRGLYDNHDFVVRTLHGIDASFEYRLTQEEMRNLVRQVVTSTAKGSVISDEDVTLVTSFYAAGLVEVVRQWVADGMHEDPAHLVMRLGFMLDGTLRGSLDRLSR